MLHFIYTASDILDITHKIVHMRSGFDTLTYESAQEFKFDILAC